MECPGGHAVSVLGDRLIERGPYRPADMNPFRVVSAAQLDEFRNELIIARMAQHATTCVWGLECSAHDIVRVYRESMGMRGEGQ